MRLKRRFPSFFEGFEETEHEVNSKEELLAIPWIKAYDEIPNHMGMFYSPNESKKYDPNAPDYLMSLSRRKDDSVCFFVVGYIFGDGKDLGLEDYKNHI
jgi:hypothetical protein